MTNEIKAALNALRTIEATLPHIDGSAPSVDSLLRISRDTIALLEASQREAPVAEGEIQRWELVADWDRDRMGKTEAWVRDFKNPVGKWVLFEDVARRLAERPSVTNVSREAIKQTLKEVESAWGEGFSETTSPTTDLHDDQADAIVELFQSAPAPGKAAPMGFLFKHRGADYISFVGERDLASFEASPAWEKIGPVYLDPPGKVADEGVDEYVHVGVISSDQGQPVADWKGAWSKYDFDKQGMKLFIKKAPK